jgi:hypothetical protein
MFALSKLTRIALLGALWVFVPRHVAAYPMTGKLVAITPDSLWIQLPGRPRMPPMELPVGFSWMSRITSDDIALSGATERAANLSELTTGQRVTVELREGWAVAVRIRRDLAVRGIVTRFSDGALVVRDAETPGKLTSFALGCG